MIGFNENDCDRIDAATLPAFRNFSPCPTCKRHRPGGLLRFCPGCQSIRGHHFHHECACGVTWAERCGD